MRLQGKTALVTGAASGFGRGIAETFARGSGGAAPRVESVPLGREHRITLPVERGGPRRCRAVGQLLRTHSDVPLRERRAGGTLHVCDGDR